uniref:Uncharacterized protein n=1 Tax=viral metagenome TaxID=1070528 RepID=A0A6C0CRM5_9ZZZZ
MEPQVDFKSMEKHNSSDDDDDNTENDDTSTQKNMSKQILTYLDEYEKEHGSWCHYSDSDSSQSDNELENFDFNDLVGDSTPDIPFTESGFLSLLFSYKNASLLNSLDPSCFESLVSENMLPLFLSLDKVDLNDDDSTHERSPRCHCRFCKHSNQTNFWEKETDVVSQEEDVDLKPRSRPFDPPEL